MYKGKINTNSKFNLTIFIIFKFELGSHKLGSHKLGSLLFI